MSHWIIVPVVLPLAAGGALVLLERLRPGWVRDVSLAAVLAQLAVAIALAAQASSGIVGAYLLGNWQAPFGIALALDRLTAMMLLLTAMVALAAVVYARGGDEARGPHFHALFQFQLMGLNGAFLTADLFNLFVFFEVLLIASYGLLLHGVGAARLRASLHYVTFNLAGSALFLIAVAMLFGLTGTLNMADLALRVAKLGAEDAVLVRSAALLLLVVFCVKAALLPLYFWLPDAYGSATAPVAALFAIMTKVGVYAIARMYTLAFGADGGVAAEVAWPWLPVFALGTLLLAAVGALAARRMRTLAAYIVIASAGTLLLAIGFGSAEGTAAALFYMVNSTLVAAALFLLVDRISAMRGSLRDALRPAPLAEGGWASTGLLYAAVAISAAGMPPLAGFLGKGFVLDAARDSPLAAWSWAVVLLSSLGIMIALARAGTTMFWAGQGGAEHGYGEEAAQEAAGGAATAAATAIAARGQARERVSFWAEGHRIAVGWLLLLVIANAAFAGPLAQFTGATARQLLERQPYISAVLGSRPVAPLWTPRRGMKK
jgi:multicomponent K+:H+ antiporter subunit D